MEGSHAWMFVGDHLACVALMNHIFVVISPPLWEDAFTEWQEGNMSYMVDFCCLS